MTHRRRLIFVTWDGPQQPYLKSLFLPLLRALAGQGYAPEVLQFTWGSQPPLVAADVGEAPVRIPVEQVAISRRLFPVSYSWQLSLGARRLAAMTRGDSNALVVVRSDLPAAMAVLALASGAHFELVFDTDGSMPDERVELGAWRPGGPMFRFFRAIEGEACRRASRVVTRSEAGRQAILGRARGLDPARVVAVPNGRDSTLFCPATASERSQTREHLGLGPDEPVVVYAGSLGPQYLPEAMGDFVERLAAQVPLVRWLVLTPMREQVERLLEARPQLRARTLVATVGPTEIPRYLGAADLGLALRRATPSQREVCPVKVAEYLLCGLPVISSRGIGDLDSLLGKGPEAVMVANDASAELETAILWARGLFELPWAKREAPARCRLLGLEHFALDRIADRYARLLA